MTIPHDSANLAQVRQFALADSVEFMVMTLASFNKASNVINQSADRLQGETPIHMVQATRPVLIIDEPQNMESEQSVRALAALDPHFALRYSATHRNPYNVVYRLTPYEAYRQGLVKRIEVASMVRKDDPGAVFLRLEGITPRSRSLTAHVAAHKLMKDGAVKEKAIVVKPGDSLEEKTGRQEYRGFEVDEIGSSFVRFANNIELTLGEERGSNKEAIFQAQIRYTVEEHFRKQERLKDAGIKVLSLFFIDRVENYAPEDGVIRQMFEKAFNELKAKYTSWSDRTVDEVQAAYFATTRKKGGEIVFENSTSGEAQKDVAAYELIMKNKERLLSFDEPVSFIFSHSALREGWDNPNVCQICTLNQSVSKMKKRQEVGRGVRLVVDQVGDRVLDERTNVLTVVANESYESYVAQLQSETKEEYGEEGTPPDPPPAQKPPAKLRKAYVLSPEFQQLWERIKQKTRYAVRIDSEKLMDDVAKELDEVRVKAPRVVASRGRVEVGEGTDEYEAYGMSAPRDVLSLAGRRPLPNLVEVMANLMDHTSPPMRLTRRTLLEIYKRTQNKDMALENPQEFATQAVRIIKSKLADQLVDGICYEKLDEWGFAHKPPLSGHFLCN